MYAIQSAIDTLLHNTAQTKQKSRLTLLPWRKQPRRNQITVSASTVHPTATAQKTHTSQCHIYKKGRRSAQWTTCMLRHRGFHKTTRFSVLYISARKNSGELRVALAGDGEPSPWLETGSQVIAALTQTFNCPRLWFVVLKMRDRHVSLMKDRCFSLFFWERNYNKWQRGGWAFFHRVAAAAWAASYLQEHNVAMCHIPAR